MFWRRRRALSAIRSSHRPDLRDFAFAERVSSGSSLGRPGQIEARDKSGSRLRAWHPQHHVDAVEGLTRRRPGFVFAGSLAASAFSLHDWWSSKHSPRAGSARPSILLEEREAGVESSKKRPTAGSYGRGRNRRGAQARAADGVTEGPGDPDGRDRQL
jgi:hypothetical protein